VPARLLGVCRRAFSRDAPHESTVDGALLGTRAAPLRTETAPLTITRRAPVRALSPVRVLARRVLLEDLHVLPPAAAHART
jgi:hypothetical protein